MEEKHEGARKFQVPKINIDEIKKASPYVIMSPRSMLQKQTSGKAPCLCSPTTHAGSFRCRHHRNSLLSRHGGSVGSNLSELANKTEFVPTATAMNDSAHSHTHPFGGTAVNASTHSHTHPFGER
ncbi:hypothetical protein AQUCO_00500376v1 [Aquilegia coerulea]|uniref:Uncharacterized protein n=1 Tax=Aquilegia coerulea TaxID=218851 RepID=A0A2G5ERP0_AQUCA|nr:hypothetical protein AQUCO_00500376v1 [Aquilegia coerulea]